MIRLQATDSNNRHKLALQFARGNTAFKWLLLTPHRIYIDRPANCSQYKFPPVCPDDNTAGGAETIPLYLIWIRPKLFASLRVI